MLGKLLKHEWRAVSRFLLLIHGILLLFVLAGRTLLLLPIPSRISGTMAVFYSMVYIFALGAVALGTCFYLILRFYRNMFTDQGYLTHTLPVKPYELLWSKSLVFLAWIILDVLVCLLSIVIMVTGFQDNGSSNLIASLKTAFEQLKCAFGNLWPLAVLLVLTMLLTLVFQWIQLAYCGICVGSLFSKHKILLSVVFCGIFYMAVQVINGIFLVFVAFGPMIFSQSFDPSAFSLRVMILGMIAMAAVLGACFYSVSRLIVAKYLNLD